MRLRMRAGRRGKGWRLRILESLESLGEAERALCGGGLLYEVEWSFLVKVTIFDE